MSLIDLCEAQARELFDELAENQCESALASAGVVAQYLILAERSNVLACLRDQVARRALALLRAGRLHDYASAKRDHSSALSAMVRLAASQPGFNFADRRAVDAIFHSCLARCEMSPLARLSLDANLAVPLGRGEPADPWSVRALASTLLDRRLLHGYYGEGDILTLVRLDALVQERLVDASCFPVRWASVMLYESLLEGAVAWVATLGSLDGMQSAPPALRAAAGAAVVEYVDQAVATGQLIALHPARPQDEEFAAMAEKGLRLQASIACVRCIESEQCA
ncbi:hypothetical protein [Stenotrophomonas sp. JAI102]|uniref:hypothetical protein n=1 Tax=Stenotrophomonas sp. JAI102 TaxID=2723077 RepID=UPI0015C82A0A|nr:hypothetical protein [Stenotrophomonas sp. JAI102]NYF35686.1 hypothetical protein [Stenotrophomonas sp. JAI102]